MQEVEDASQAMEQRGSRKDQSRLLEIWKATAHSMVPSMPSVSHNLLLLLAQDQIGELKIIATEARNHLYAVLKDTELWQEALQSECCLR